MEQEATWHRSTLCNTGGNCVEVKFENSRVVVRSSVRVEAEISLSEEEWAAFVGGIRSGDFDGVDSRSLPADTACSYSGTAKGRNTQTV